MSGSAPVTLQITLAPTDLPTARYTVPHQIRVWGNQVSEILLTVDLHRSAGKYGEAWRERLPGLRQLISGLSARDSRIKSADVDYGQETVSAIGQAFFGGFEPPPKDHIGGPFYSFFFGLYRATEDHVLHLDSDMMFGGGSQTWISEAVRVLAEREEVLVVSPLPGPPTADGLLRSQTLELDSTDPRAYRASIFSTRTCLVSKRKFQSLLGPLPLSRPPIHRAAQAWLEGNPPYDLVETIISRDMGRRRLLRIEMDGRSPGMWGVHPLYRSKLFYEELPRIIYQVENGRLHEAQAGHHDLVDSVIDFRSARLPRWKRVQRKLRIVANRVLAAK